MMYARNDLKPDIKTELPIVMVLQYNVSHIFSLLREIQESETFLFVKKIKVSTLINA